MAPGRARGYLPGMLKGRIPVWMATAFTFVVVVAIIAFRNSSPVVFIPPVLAVAWGWRSALKGIRERRNAQRS